MDCMELFLHGLAVSGTVDDDGTLWMEGCGCNMASIKGKEEAIQLIKHLMRLYKVETDGMEP